MKNNLDTLDTKNNIISEDIPEEMVGMSKVFARAKKRMSLNEFKTFIYCLCQIHWTDPEMPKTVCLDKITLARILKMSIDPVNLARNLRLKIGDLVDHSIITFESKDSKKWQKGALITRVAINEDRVVIIDFNSAYAQLFCNLKKDFILLWSKDIFGMELDRSITIYEFLRLNCDTRVTNSRVFTIDQIRELLDIPTSGTGSYMRKDGRFDRHAFETKVLDLICEDLERCEMLQLVPQEDKNGDMQLYKRIKQGRKLIGYEFVWNVTDYPRISNAHEAQETKQMIEKDPSVLKIARDIKRGKKKKTKDNPFNQFEQNEYDFDELEKEILNN